MLVSAREEIGKLNQDKEELHTNINTMLEAKKSYNNLVCKLQADNEKLKELVDRAKVIIRTECGAESCEECRYNSDDIKCELVERDSQWRVIMSCEKDLIDYGYAMCAKDNAVAIKIYDKIKDRLPTKDCKNCQDCGLVYELFNPNSYDQIMCHLAFETNEKYGIRPGACRKFFGGSDDAETNK